MTAQYQGARNRDLSTHVIDDLVAFAAGQRLDERLAGTAFKLIAVSFTHTKFALAGAQHHGAGVSSRPHIPVIHVSVLDDNNPAVLAEIDIWIGPGTLEGALLNLCQARRRGFGGIRGRCSYQADASNE